MFSKRAIQPNLSELNLHLAEIVTTNDAARISALRAAVQWYETSAPFYRMRFSPSQEKALQRALLCAVQGRGGATLGEEEQGLRMAMLQFEKALQPSIPNLPKVQTYYDKLDADRARLEAQAAALRARFDDLLQPMERCFQGVGVGFEVRKVTQNRSLGDRGNIIYSEEYAQQLISRMRTEGQLAVILSEAPVVLKAACMVRDSLGNVTVDATKMSSRTSELFGKLANLASIVGARINPSGVSGSTSPTPNPAPPTPKPKPTVVHTHAGTYRPGSNCAILLERLRAHCAGGALAWVDDLLAGMNSKAPRSILNDVATDGRASGKWEVRIIGRGSRARVAFTEF